jgi:hypothetical protein
MTQTSATSQGSKLTADRDAIRPFHANVPEAELTESRRRVQATKWPERETVADASQGIQLATIQALARYWATEYDWRKIEGKLNALPQLVTEIDGLEIHFIHVRSKHENALPLMRAATFASMSSRPERPKLPSGSAGLAPQCRPNSPPSWLICTPRRFLWADGANRKNSRRLCFSWLLRIRRTSMRSSSWWTAD